jgi:hypothetical protein
MSLLAHILMMCISMLKRSTVRATMSPLFFDDLVVLCRFGCLVNPIFLLELNPHSRGISYCSRVRFHYLKVNDNY